MGRRGPLKRSTACNALTGNPGKRKRKRKEKISPAPKRFACPSWLDTAAKKKWHEAHNDLHAAGLLRMESCDALACYCLAFSEVQRAASLLHKHGRFYTNKSGELRQHPAYNQLKSAWQAVLRFSAVLGLDPMSRARLLDGMELENQDELTKFLSENDDQDPSHL